ncbi:MAG: HTH-type transcriptional activator IlvY [Pseudomonadota bacterium]
MDARTLNQFLTLADTLHFGRAADACHMSASTLSRAIKQLEETVGVALFQRDNRSVALTREGVLFRRYARESVALWADFEDSLIDATQALSGTLTLYGSVTASYSFLFDLLATLHEEHPGIKVTLQTGDPEQAIKRVQSGEAHISLGARPAKLARAIRFKTIATTPLVFIAATDDARALSLTRKRTTADQWRSMPLIVPERGVARDRTLAWFRDQNITPAIAAQVAGNEAIVSMVSLGGGIGVVPRIVLDNSPLADRVTVLGVRHSPEPLEVGLFVLNKSLKNRLVSALWETAGA